MGLLEQEGQNEPTGGTGALMRWQDLGAASQPITRELMEKAWKKIEEDLNTGEKTYFDALNQLGN